MSNDNSASWNGVYNGTVNELINEYLNRRRSLVDVMKPLQIENNIKMQKAQEEALDKFKYYVPAISDLRVGYEFEYNGHYIHMTSGWKKNIITPEWYGMNHDSGWDSDPTITFYMGMLRAQPQNFRVTYLTKDQIEAEGWNHTGGQLSSVSRQDYEKLVGIRGICELHYTELNHKLLINQRNHVRDASGKYTLIPIYDGYCPSINEFRQISKLLNICTVE